VPDLDAAIAWYTSVLGLELLGPPVALEGAEIEADMGELVPGISLRGAILGVGEAGDHVLELLEYPRHPGRPRPPDRSLTDHGVSHLGLVCDDLVATRARLEARGVEFLTRGSADIAGLRTTWFRDPWGVVFILMQKRDPARPYYVQAPTPARERR
jgi:catechol 2,3-dioxygenase-like lactoylglutathione lyase family enzyme